MLRRLLIAVFVIGLITAFSGTAFSDINPDGIEAKKIERNDVNLSDKARLPQSQTQPEDFQRSVDDAQGPYYGVTGRAGVSSPDTSACYEQDYTDYAGTSFYYGWTRPGGDTRELAMRFSVPTNHVAELDGSWVYFFEVQDQAELTLTVYGDIAGVPDDADIIYTESFGPLAEDLVGGWYYFPWSAAPVVLDGYTDYHIGAKSTGLGAEVLVFASDDGGDPVNGGTATGTKRSSYRSGGVWYTVLDLFGDGTDINLMITSIQCVYYSECYAQNGVAGGSVYLWAVPDNVWGDGSTLEGFGQRFVADGPETVTAVRLYHYSFGTYGPTGTNSIDIAIWPDDGTGNIDDSGGPIYSANVPGGLANLYPGTGDTGGWEVLNIALPSPPVVFGPWHVTVRMTSANPADGQIVLPTSTDASNVAVDGSVYYSAPGAGWELSRDNATWMTEVGFEIGYFFRVTMCKDEFYDCKFQATFNAGATTGYGLPLNIATRIAAGGVNRLNAIYWQFIDPTLFGDPATTYSQEVVVWADGGGGFPGAELWRSSTLNFGDLTPYPGWNELVIPGGLQILGDFYIGYEDVSADPVNEYFYYGVEEDNGPEVNGGAKYYSTGSAAWRDLGDAAGADDNAIMYADFCTIPVDRYPCMPGTEWVTLQHDFQRTGHSMNAMGDAYCDLTNIWTYNSPDVAGWSAPMIKDGLVVVALNDEYVVLNLDDGTVAASLPTGTNSWCIPTVANIGGSDMLFVAGGDDGDFTAYTWPALTFVWTANAAGTNPTTRFGNFIVLNDGVTDVLYAASDQGRIHAFNAATGTAYAGWAGPLVITGFAPTTSRNGATDGIDKLYYGARDVGFLGDVYCVNAFTRAINWQLSATGGLQAETLYGLLPFTSDEGFRSGLTYEPAGDGNPARLWANSIVSGGDNAGVFYSLDANTGSILLATKAHGSTYAHPLLDASRVYIPSFSTFFTPPSGGDLIAYNKSNGNAVWAASSAGERPYLRYYTDGLITCEGEGKVDQIYAFNENGYLSCFNSESGEEIFHRRVDYLAGTTPDNGFINVGSGGAMVTDTMVFVSSEGSVIALAKTGVPRPRLEVLQWRARAGVPFGTNPDTTIVFTEMLTNTGCDVLDITMVADLLSNGTNGAGKVTGIPTNKLARSAELADGMTNTFRVDDVFDAENMVKASVSRDRVNTAATAAPPYLVVSTYNMSVNPGDVADVAVRVDQSQISRGLYRFYLELQSNDPDYYLNDNAQMPELYLTIVGGCSIDTSTLHFGVGGANFQLVTNTGRVGATGDWDPPGVISVDGQGSLYFGGSYVYGISQRRIAMNSNDWVTGTSPLDGEDASFVSLQPDFNYVSGECKPAVGTLTDAPEYSLDGITYQPFNAVNVVYASFLDSVQNFELDGVWDWENVTSDQTGGFDNDSTIGLYVDAHTVGVEDAPSGFNLEYLNNLTIAIFDIRERNGNTVEGWAMGHYADYDINVSGGSHDTVGFNRPISSAWMYAVGGGVDAFGTTKLPFGGPYENIINTRGITGISDAGGFWGYGTYWDSTYKYMAEYPIGISSVPMTSGDGEAHQTFVRDVTFGPNGTYKFAVVQWGLLNMTNPNSAAEIAPLANIANKFAGFGRGDVTGDDLIDLADVIYLANYAFHGGAGPVPFAHLGDVNADGNIDLTDINYMVDYYFNFGPAPVGDWEI
ncbi:PQQ-binding-like beta-propeller repeat protein [bacterium]|nr:PQQ-binding-like beta-propeller repeat protein [bacterium]